MIVNLPVNAQALIEPLTATQLIILRLVDEGLSNRDIASRLSITEGTTKSIVQQIVRVQPHAGYRAGAARTFTTTAQGTFAFENISPGEYEVKVTAKGFVSQLQVIVVQV